MAPALRKHQPTGPGPTTMTVEEWSAEEAIEMAYENIQTLAADTIRAKRRPKV